jgi:nitrogen regulatory protein P-II 1
MKMRKIDVIVAHERLIEINEIIHKHKLGGMTFYNIKGRDRSKLEPVALTKGF